MQKIIKKYLFLLIFAVIQPLAVATDGELRTPLSYLTAMTKAHQKSNYELLYLLQQDGNVESYRLRHTFKYDKEYAQLLNLDHSREEIILRNQIVSYLGYNFRPFSLNSPHILDNLPNVIYTDFANLQGYSFLDLGKDRVADRRAKVIRLAPNDHFRYAYLFWIDEETQLLLKSQLIGQDNTVLEEFRVLQLYQSPELEMLSSAIDGLMLPALVSNNKEGILSPYQWRTDWLPLGFRLIDDQTMSGKSFFTDDKQIDSRLYSDGLSTFNIYVMPSQGVNFSDYAWQQGKLTILNQTVQGNDVVIIGEIPVVTAREILKNIHFEGENAQ